MLPDALWVGGWLQQQNNMATFLEIKIWLVFLDFCLKYKLYGHVLGS